jgi:hypothetical protein
VGSSVSDSIDVALCAAVRGSALATEATMRIAAITKPKTGAANPSVPLRMVHVFSALRRWEMSAIHHDRDMYRRP